MDGETCYTQVVGFRVSQVLYWALILSAYGVAGALAVVRFKGCALAMLTLPLAVSALKDCKPEVRMLYSVWASTKSQHTPHIRCVRCAHNRSSLRNPCG